MYFFEGPITPPLFLDLIVNLSMLQGFVFVTNVDGAYWSLQYELVFYVLIFSVYKLKLLHKIELIILIWLILQSIMIAFKYYSLWFPYSVEILLLLEYANLFASGILFYLVWSKQETKFTHMMILFCFFITALASSFAEALILSLVYISFYLLSYKKLRFIAIKPLIFIGAISYSLYLTHQNIGYIVLTFFQKIGFSNLISVTLTLIFSIVLATILTQSIEKPMQKTIRSIYKKNSKSSLNLSIYRNNA
jgi:peptidoglycan/LPS O-acetylase OafA/YrhL